MRPTRFTATITRPLLLLACMLGATPFTPSHADPHGDLVAKGKYLTSLGGCESCHSASDGPPFAGGLYMNTPYGPISTPNITPDKETGIGTWTDDEFYKAMHDGLGKKGEYLYPVMPFPWYTKVRREDVTAIRAYLQTIPAVHKVRPPNKLAFPFSVRESLLAWRTVFFKAGEFEADTNQSAEVNRGAYLVNGLAHCGECHNAHPVAGQSRFRKAFAGGVVDDWYAPNITGDARDGIGSWSNDQLVQYLKTGVSPDKGIAVGPMAETVQNLSHLNDSDLQAMAAYLKSTRATPEKHVKLALFEGRDAAGSDVYLNYCASCHAVDGKGLANVVPGLQGNGAVDAQGPQNVIRAIVGGLEARAGYAPMVAVGSGMSDEEIAAVTNFVRQGGSNSSPANAEAGMVAKLRDETQTLMNGSPKTGCAQIADPVVLKAVNSSGIVGYLESMADEGMLKGAHEVVVKMRRADPRISQADLVNAVTAAYCPAIRKQTNIDANAKAIKIGQFSELVYTEASSRRVSAR